jgi:hypothetical protein
LNPTVQCDRIELARLEKGQFFSVLLSEGEHSCGLIGSAAADRQLVFIVMPNEDYFVKYGGKANKKLEHADRSAFSKELKHLKEIELGAIKSPMVITPQRN